MSADLRVLTVAGLAREGALEQARSELERLVARSPRLRSQDQLPSRYLTSDDHIALSEDALGPRHLTKLAPVLERLDPSGMARAVAEIAAAANALPTSLTTLARFATADVS
jgi:hypothetical protein